MNEKMKVIFFGLGSIGKRHVEILKKNYPEIEIFAYRSGVKLSRIEGVTNIFALTDIDFKSFDIAFICSPPHLHISTAIYCLDKGLKNIFIEKPLSHNLEDVDLLLDVSEKNDAIIYVGYNMRFSSIMMRLKELIKKIHNSIFYVNVFQSSYLPNWRKNIDYRDVYSSKKLQGGGVILDLSHEFDYVEFLFGKIRLLEGMHGKISHLEIDSEDYCDASLKTESGIKGLVHLDYFGCETQRKVRIFYKEGQIIADFVEGTITIIRDKEDSQVFSFYEHSLNRPAKIDLGYESQIKYFLNGVEKKDKNISNLKESKELLEKLLDFKKIVRVYI